LEKLEGSVRGEGGKRHLGLWREEEVPEKKNGEMGERNSTGTNPYPRKGKGEEMKKIAGKGGGGILKWGTVLKVKKKTTNNKTPRDKAGSNKDGRSRGGAAEGNSINPEGTGGGGELLEKNTWLTCTPKSTRENEKRARKERK